MEVHISHGRNPIAPQVNKLHKEKCKAPAQTIEAHTRHVEAPTAMFAAGHTSSQLLVVGLQQNGEKDWTDCLSRWIERRDGEAGKDEHFVKQFQR